MPTSLFRYRFRWRVLAMIALLAVGSWWLTGPGMPVARATNAGYIQWDQSMIYPGLNNGQPEGPVGEPAIVHGIGFQQPGETIQLVVVAGDSNASTGIGGPGDGSPLCTLSGGGTSAVVGTVTVSSSGTFDAHFAWPALTSPDSSGLNSICALDATTHTWVYDTFDAGTFTVLSQSVPAFSLSSSSVAAGSTVTITGVGWVPAQALYISISSCSDCDQNSSNSASAATNSVGNSSGTFSVKVALPATLTANNYIVNVFSKNGPLNAAHIDGLGPKQLAVTAAVPAATPTATATTMATTTSANNSSNSGGGNSSLIIILLVVAVLLGAAGTIFIFLARRYTSQTNKRSAGRHNDSWQKAGGGYGQGQAQSFRASSPNQDMFPRQASFIPFPQRPMGNGSQQGFNQQGYAQQSTPSWPVQQQPWQNQAGGPQSQPGYYDGFPPSQQQVHQCQRCGNPLNAGNLVCGNCGLRNFSGGYNDPTTAY